MHSGFFFKKTKMVDSFFFFKFQISFDRPFYTISFNKNIEVPKRIEQFLSCRPDSLMTQNFKT